MLRIGVTGAYGLIGWHVRCRFFTNTDVEAIPVGRTEFQDTATLDEFVRQCDAVVHLAGMNRGDNAEVERVNLGLADALIAAMERVGSRPHIVFSSSIHIYRDTAYGRSKLAAADTFGQWADRQQALFTNLVLPHAFGEHGRPNYNSVVSTFCHQLSKGQQPRIEHDGQLELLHAQEVADVALECIRNRITGEIGPCGRRIRVSDMLERLADLAGRYGTGVIPEFEDLFDLRLFNTYRSYLFPDFYPKQINLHSDDRGSLFEAVKTDHGGQAFLSTTKPGITRGDHFHLNKVERFLVVRGEALIRLRRLFDNRIVEFRVRGDRPAFVDIPTLHTHNITNVGNGELLTLFWSHEIFDPEYPDTYREPVVRN